MNVHLLFLSCWKHFADVAKTFWKCFVKGGSFVKMTNFTWSLTLKMSVFLFLDCLLPEDKDSLWCLQLFARTHRPVEGQTLFSESCSLLSFLSLLFWYSEKDILEVPRKHSLSFAHVNPNSLDDFLLKAILSLEVVVIIFYCAFLRIAFLLFPFIHTHQNVVVPCKQAADIYQNVAFKSSNMRC